MSARNNFKVLSVEVLSEDYEKVKSQLHHGQLSEITRTFLEALAETFETSGKSNIYQWLDGEAPLTIHSPAYRRKYDIND